MRNKYCHFRSLRLERYARVYFQKCVRGYSHLSHFINNNNTTVVIDNLLRRDATKIQPIQQQLFLYSIRLCEKKANTTSKQILRNTAAEIVRKLITAFRTEFYERSYRATAISLFSPSCFSSPLLAFAVNPNPIWRETCHARETNLSAPVKLFHYSRTKMVHLLPG